jgi:hypothetical protein
MLRRRQLNIALIPAHSASKTGIQRDALWVPAFAGTNGMESYTESLKL